MPLQLWVDFVLVWFILFPAYAANAVPVLVGGKRPLDFGKGLGKNRILGDGKTIEGTALGIAAGFLVGALEYYVMPALQGYAAQYNVLLPQITLPLALAIAAGTMCGDILGSFFKRRMGIERGGKEPLLDRLGFIIFAMIFAYPFIQITPAMAVYMIAITYVIHRAANFVAYNAKLKTVPW
ncbi:MAG: CDP-2,3-bis-(O-geranylgeranyl)-sn-glycerol synthase [Candidatus Aenigmarchaeota archaeon]|nr:CDP-2,3-bis-(O-geranylgeranyl)-sn-glycerol synthase [Candidatus Aenigmarchaeota archaeon]